VIENLGDSNASRSSVSIYVPSLLFLQQNFMNLFQIRNVHTSSSSSLVHLRKWTKAAYSFPVCHATSQFIVKLTLSILLDLAIVCCVAYNKSTPTSSNTPN
jgi:hypothetical protein